MVATAPARLPAPARLSTADVATTPRPETPSVADHTADVGPQGGRSTAPSAHAAARARGPRLAAAGLPCLRGDVPQATSAVGMGVCGGRSRGATPCAPAGPARGPSRGQDPGPDPGPCRIRRIQDIVGAEAGRDLSVEAGGATAGTISGIAGPGHPKRCENTHLLNAHILPSLILTSKYTALDKCKIKFQCEIYTD